VRFGKTHPFHCSVCDPTCCIQIRYCTSCNQKPLLYLTLNLWPKPKHMVRNHSRACSCLLHRTVSLGRRNHKKIRTMPIPLPPNLQWADSGVKLYLAYFPVHSRAVAMAFAALAFHASATSAANGSSKFGADINACSTR
jgi:hypothetical protein